MTVWITGANGFIGRYLARELADAGHAVHGIGHGAIEDFERQRLGLRDVAQWRDRRGQSQCACRAHGLPSKIFHLAGGSSVGLSIAQPFEDFSRTVASTARLLEWLRGSAPECRLIVASSAAVYGARSWRTDFRACRTGTDVAVWSAQADDGATVPKLCGQLRRSQHGRAVVLGLRAASSQAIAVGHMFPAAER